MSRMHILTFLPLLAACHGEQDTGEPYDASGWPLGEVVATDGKGILAEIETTQGTLQVLRLRGDYAEMGRQAGVLVGEQVPALWQTFVASFASELGMDPDSAEDAMMELLDGAWGHMLPYIPPSYVELIMAMNSAAGYDEDDCIPCRVVAITNISDLDFDSTAGLLTMSSGVSGDLEDYYAGQGASASLSVPTATRHAGPAGPFQTCSFFSAWGGHTQDAHLLASRNLDWSSDTGIANHKLLTIFHPEGEGAGHPYATIGYVSLLGALAGLSSEGIAVAEVGSTGVLARLTGEPWVIRHMELLEHATDLDEALLYHTNQVGDGLNRPPTIGYNFMVAYGDPGGSGASAEAAVVEANGAMVGVHRGGAAGVAEVHYFGEDGAHASALELGDEGVNLEADAVEIDADGQARLFLYGDEGWVTDDDGQYVEDPGGIPMPTGLALQDALFRGDEAMSHAVRRWQLAANGPQEGDGDLMVDSSSYRGRYSPSYEMLSAWESGVAWEDDGQVVVPDNGGEPVLMGMDEAVTLASHVAMGCNILSVVYDATALRVRVAYEVGSGDDWQAARDQEYTDIELGPAFDFE